MDAVCSHAPRIYPWTPYLGMTPLLAMDPVFRKGPICGDGGYLAGWWTPHLAMGRRMVQLREVEVVFLSYVDRVNKSCKYV